MSALHGWDLPLGFIALGALFIGVAWLCLAEYRRLFFADPRSPMSLEVLAKVLGGGGPGYLAIVALIIGAVFVSVGILAFLFGAATSIAELLHRLFPAT